MPNQRCKKDRASEAGFTLIMVVFLVASMILFAAMAAPVVLTEGRREMEKETIWRGEQYRRAIGLYYRKFGHPPTKVEDLTRMTNGVRFLRQAYTDPMNKEDGSWRFIYMGPNGQLIGSVRQTSLLQNALSVPTIGGGTSPFGGGLQPLQAPSGAPPLGVGAPGQITNAAANSNSSEPQPQPLEGPVIGGNIIGVGSKVKLPAFRLYLGGDTYEKWEFIFNPMLLNQPMQPPPSQPGAPGVPVPGAPQLPGAAVTQQPPPGQQ
jgi:type II secretory pathway pseudopilin PulG